jgi:hypothetical protein
MGDREVSKPKKIVLVLATLTLALAGCSKATESFNDADISKKQDKPAEVYSMPDGFSNVATKCDDHGNRIYVAFHGDSAYGAIAVVPADPTCGK